MNKDRMIYIDNIRLLMIILVIIQHLAVTYSSLGDWYYNEPSQLSTIELVLFGFHQSFTQAYFMGILFFIAGYFVPSSYDKKGFGQFIKDRFIRLGMPTLLYMLVIDPFINIVLLNHWDFTNTTFLNAYFKYVVGFQFIRSSGPLWFAFALLIFSILYAFIKKFFYQNTIYKKQTCPSIFNLFLLILFMSICTFLIRINQPIGTNFINMQLCFFPQYIILFIIGIKSKKGAWLDKIDYSKHKIWLFLGVFLGLISWLTFMILGGALSGNLDIFYGGMSWQSAAYCLWESFVVICISIGLIALFKQKCNQQNNLIYIMSSNAFSVYVFHSPIIVTLSLLFQPLHLMPFIKFIILIPISIVICFSCSNYVIRNIPFIKKI